MPPTREGLLPATDIARLQRCRQRLTALFAEDLAEGRPGSWRVTGERTPVGEIDLGSMMRVGLARLEEDITPGVFIQASGVFALGRRSGAPTLPDSRCVGRRLGAPCETPSN